MHSTDSNIVHDLNWPLFISTLLGSILRISRSAETQVFSKFNCLFFY